MRDFSWRFSGYSEGSIDTRTLSKIANDELSSETEISSIF